MLRLSLIAAALAVSACHPDIYVRDGVTDGDTFYLAPLALVDDDPALQSWVTYSLVKSTCQLEIGGANPSRASSYGCEMTARMRLVDAWQAQRAEHPSARDEYLDAMLAVYEAGFLDEYTVRYFGDDHWQVPAEVDLAGFRRWQRQHLPGHSPETRLIGSWGFRAGLEHD